MIYTIFPVVFALLLVQKEHRLTRIETISRVLKSQAEKAPCATGSLQDDAILLAVLSREGEILQVKSTKISKLRSKKLPEGSEGGPGIPAEAADLSAYIGARFLPDKRLAYATVDKDKEEMKEEDEVEKEEMSWPKSPIKFANMSIEELAEKLTMPTEFKTEVNRIKFVAQEAVENSVSYMTGMYYYCLENVKALTRRNWTSTIETSYYWILAVGFLFIIMWLHRFLLLIVLLSWDLTAIICSQGFKAICFVLGTVNRILFFILRLPLYILKKIAYLLRLCGPSCHLRNGNENVLEEISADPARLYTRPKDHCPNNKSAPVLSTIHKNQSGDTSTREVSFYHVEHRGEDTIPQTSRSQDGEKSLAMGRKQAHSAEVEKRGTNKHRRNASEDGEVFYDTVWDTDKIFNKSKEFATSTPRPSLAPPKSKFSYSSTSIREEDVSLTPKKLQRFLHEQYNRLRALGISFNGNNLDYLNLTGANCAPDFIASLDSFVEVTRYRIKRRLLNVSAVV